MKSRRRILIIEIHTYLFPQLQCNNSKYRDDHNNNNTYRGSHCSEGLFGSLDPGGLDGGGEGMGNVAAELHRDPDTLEQHGNSFVGDLLISENR